MLVPRRVKYRKQMRGTRTGVASRGTTLSNGDFGIQTLESAWVTSRQIEAARRAITHYIARGGKVWIKIFPDKPISKKPPEVRMGSGKGDIHEYVAVVKPGRILFEMGGVTKAIAMEALRLASHKLPVKTKFVMKGE
ncbi:MAG TPA: 50S ribosomal protein L16 [Candidatus Eisenbacteria bacterium]|nr:50S ribosomal protein L16 [Candidatus Eisenbacteria bacterium]